MAKPFNELRERLLRAGVAPRHVRRYLTELADHLADLRAEEERAGRSRADAESAALIRLGGMDDLAKAMTEQRQFQSWCVRAPWATFGLAPLFLLAGAWFVACLFCGLVGRSFCRDPIRLSSRWVDRYMGSRMSTFGNRQGALFRCADSHRLGNRTHRRPSKIQRGLAHCRFGPGRIDWRHGPGPRGPPSRPRRNRTCQHGLRPGDFR